MRSNRPLIDGRGLIKRGYFFVLARLPLYSIASSCLYPCALPTLVLFVFLASPTRPNADGTAQLEKYASVPLAIAWVLRQFLAELPEPLLTKRFGSSFLKTQLNPDHTARYRNMRILLKALPAVNHAVLRSVLELFRLILHHRRKNKLTVSGFCQELGPVLLGFDKVPQNAQAAADLTTAAEVLKTLITQYQFMVGNTDEPAEYDSLPLFTKKSKHVMLTHSSRARGLLAKQRGTAPSMQSHLPFSSSISSLGSHSQQMFMGNTARGATFSGMAPSGMSSSVGSFSTSSLPQPFLPPTAPGANGNANALNLMALHGTSAPMLFANMANNTAGSPEGPMSFVLPGTSSGTGSMPVGSPLGGTMALSPPSAASLILGQTSNSPSSLGALPTALMNSTNAFGPGSGSGMTAAAAQAVPFTPLSFPLVPLSQASGVPNVAGLTSSSAGLNAPSSSHSTSHPQLHHQLSTGSNNSEDAEELISLTDGIMSKFLDQTVRTVLFEPQVRISFNYEAKIPNQLKRNYTLDKWSEMQRGGMPTFMESTLRQGAWRPSLEDEIPGSGLITGRRRRDSNREDSIADSDARYRRNTTTTRDDSVPMTSRVHTAKPGQDDDHDGPGAGGRREKDSSHSKPSEKETRAEREARLAAAAAAEKEGKSDKSDREGGAKSDTTAGTHTPDGGESSGSTSSRRRSRRVSVTQDEGTDTHDHNGGSKERSATVSTVRRMSVDSSYSDEIAGRRHVSADQLSEIDSLSLSDSDDDDDEHATNASDDIGKTRRSGSKQSKREEQMNRRASASKVSTGPRSKINTSGKKRRTTLSTELTGDLDLGTSPDATATSSASSTATHDNRSKSGKANRRSKPPHMHLDSKTIMEMAPSPPSEMPPPLTPAPSNSASTNPTSATDNGASEQP